MLDFLGKANTSINGLREDDTESHWLTQLNIFGKLKEDLMATFSRNSLTSISSLVAIVFKGLMIWGSKWHQNNSPVVCDGNVK